MAESYLRGREAAQLRQVRSLAMQQQLEQAAREREQYARTNKLREVLSQAIPGMQPAMVSPYIADPERVAGQTPDAAGMVNVGGRGLDYNALARVLSEAGLGDEALKYAQAGEKLAWERAQPMRDVEIAGLKKGAEIGAEMRAYRDAFPEYFGGGGAGGMSGIPVGTQMKMGPFTIDPAAAANLDLARSKEARERRQELLTTPMGSGVPNNGMGASTPSMTGPVTNPYAGMTPLQVAELKAKRFQEQPKQKAALEQTFSNVNSSIKQIDRLLDDTTGIARITGSIYGREYVPNMSDVAINAQAALDTLKSQLGVRTLSDMRAASASGGAVGSVSEKEWPILQNQLESLQQVQTTEQFTQNLKDLRETLIRVGENSSQAYNDNYGGNTKYEAPKRKGDEQKPAAGKKAPSGFRVLGVER